LSKSDTVHHKHYEDNAQNCTERFHNPSSLPDGALIHIPLKKVEATIYISYQPGFFSMQVTICPPLKIYTSPVDCDMVIAIARVAAVMAAAL
jgi:hypothetical protein